MYVLCILGAKQIGLPDRFSFGGDTFRVEKATQAWGMTRYNRSVLDLPLRVDGVEYSSGIGTHAASRIRLNVYKAKSFFSGKCGVDDGAGGPGSVQCAIEIDGKEIFRTGILHIDEPAAEFIVPIGGANMVDLIVYDGGDGIGFDHADWLNLHFY